MKPRSGDIEAKLVKILFSFRSRPPNESEQEWKALTTFVVQLSKLGWNRRKIYDFMLQLASKHGNSLPPEGFDALTNYITVLTGDVSSDCFVRLQGEPADEAEFYRYVLEKKWMK